MMPICTDLAASSASEPKRPVMVPCSPLLPGLPDDLALLCLARVPSLSLLWSVASSWQALVSHSHFFHTLRATFGFKPQLWLYTLLHDAQAPTSHDQESPHDLHDSLEPPPTFSWHAFDPVANRWHRLPPLPHHVKFQLTSPSFIGLLHSVQCTSSNSKLFMVAGSRRSNSIFDKCNELSHVSQDLDRQPLEPALECPLIFDTQTRTWTQGAPFRVPRKWCACGTASGKLIIASGCGKDWDLAVSKSVEMYDPEDRKWETLDQLKSSKFSGEAISAVNYDGKLHMVSGKGVFWKVGVIYDPKSGRWSDMPRGMRSGWNGPCVVVDGTLLVLEDCTGRLKAYDQNEDSWATVMKEDMLKNMEQLIGCGPGKLCGIIRGPLDSALHQGDVIQIVDIRGTPTVHTLQPPFGQVVALQALSRTLME